jgi:hypothetical protein
MPDNYPTREEIMSEEQKFKGELLKQIKQWKRETWSAAKLGGEDPKFLALQGLVQIMATAYNLPVKTVYTPELDSCCYIPMTTTICINHTLSIISTMHEFGHHLHGASELDACRFSVWLFKKTFSKAYENLEWSGHMLVRPNPLNNL